MLRRRPGSLADANSLGPPACRTPLWLGRQDAAEVASADATEGKLVAIGTRSIAPMSAGPAITRDYPFWTAVLTGDDLPEAGHAMTSMSLARLQDDIDDCCSLGRGSCVGNGAEPLLARAGPCRRRPPFLPVRSALARGRWLTPSSWSAIRSLARIFRAPAVRGQGPPRATATPMPLSDGGSEPRPATALDLLPPPVPAHPAAR